MSIVSLCIDFSCSDADLSLGLTLPLLSIMIEKVGFHSEWVECGGGGHP